MVKGYSSLNSFFGKNKFIGSYTNYNDIPLSNMPEICFLGRSNVGKSSLINRITHTSNLAKSSKVPGRTKSINFFCINNKILFADLPGYGFAKIPLILKEQLSILLKNYISNRKNLRMIFF